jgi:DNA helicase MCM9
MSPEAEEVLSMYFTTIRQQQGRDLARSTVRMLESVARLTKAHAKLMGRDT